MSESAFHRAVVLSAVGLSVVALSDIQARTAQADCLDLPSHAELKAELDAVVSGGGNAGLGHEVWASIVDRAGTVCAVAFSGDVLGELYSGSRVIAAQKANTANAFSLEGLYPNLPIGRALASGNLYGLVLEQGYLFGFQASNPVDTTVAYKGPPSRFGQSNDPMVGKVIGGTVVFGGGLALYDEEGVLLGGLGVSAETPCADHIIAWKIRDGLELDFIPGGVAPAVPPSAPNGTDNLIIATPVTPNTLEHPTCLGDPNDTIISLPTEFPIGGDGG